MRFVAVTVCALFLLCGVALAHAASKPDILGLALGTPVDEAQKKLQAIDPTFDVKVLKYKDGTLAGYNALRIDAKHMTINGPKVEEQIVVQAGNDGKVNFVGRGKAFSKEEKTLDSTLAAALEEKYGKPTVPHAKTWDRVMVWVFDRAGKLSTNPGLCMRDARNPEATISWSSKSIGAGVHGASILVPYNLTADCGTLILANISQGSPDGSDVNRRVDAFSVAVIDVASQYDDAVADAAKKDKLEQQQREKAKSAKPAL